MHANVVSFVPTGFQVTRMFLQSGILALDRPHCPISQASLHSDTAWPGRGDDAAPSPPTPVSAAHEMFKQRWRRRCHCHSGNLNAMAMTTTATWNGTSSHHEFSHVQSFSYVDQVRFSSLFRGFSSYLASLSSFLQMMIFDIYMTVYFYVPCNA
ncbi:hypothetical protein F5148DRAFT_777968 [Russula earlei]|uniref:Uncharacterized protein n=1 Tax=Russula earlei TaxID=71964 RepID=A0ACC0UBZ7_9AGAM|nr:hypothetical protein F5148DRAFT_777968 [Russula earlei]